MLIVVKLKELICKCVITHQRQQREGANYETGTLGIKLCPGHATKLFLSAEKQEGTEDTIHIQKERDVRELACKMEALLQLQLQLIFFPFTILIKAIKLLSFTVLIS